MCWQPMTWEERLEDRRTAAITSMQALVAGGFSVEQPPRVMREEAKAFLASDFAKALGILKVPNFWYLHE